MYDRDVLTATSETRIGNAGMRITLAFERQVRGTVIRRENLAFDTRFAAAAAGRIEDVGHVFLLLAGRFVPTDGEPVHAPVAFVLGDDEQERVTARSRTFRTDGERVDVIQIRLDRRALAVPIGLAAGPLAIAPACWDAAGHVIHEPTAIGVLLDAFAATGITRGPVAIHDEPERYRRIWEALRPLYQTYGGTASLKQLAGSLGMSMRQVGRDAKDMAATFGFGTGYRDTLLVLRLRIAVLLLSAPGATVAEVATIVGYGSPIAMARAFRDAKLPAPTAVQASLRGE